MAAKELKLGIIGMSEGNGHPYSWSAIFNGYDPKEMASCPFPVIPEYLAEQNWPEARLKGAKVTHIWTQDRLISNDIARAAHIPYVVDKIEDLVSEVDAILLARDDAERHLEMALPLLQAGLPVYVDKPLALSLRDAGNMVNAEQYEGQLFSCSSLRFAPEIYLSDSEKENLGQIIYIQAQIPKSWEKYSVHILEPIIAGNPGRGNLMKIETHRIADITKTQIIWEQLEAEVSTFGKYAVPLRLTYFGKKSFIQKDFSDTFRAFKASLADFVKVIHSKQVTIPRKDTMEIVHIIEQGLHA